MTVSTETVRPFCSFYLPKCCLVLVYVGVSALMFLLHGRVPDRMCAMPWLCPAHVTSRSEIGCEIILQKRHSSPRRACRRDEYNRWPWQTTHIQSHFVKKKKTIHLAQQTLHISAIFSREDAVMVLLEIGYIMARKHCSRPSLSNPYRASLIVENWNESGCV